jgi:hypothetical protein
MSRVGRSSGRLLAQLLYAAPGNNRGGMSLSYGTHVDEADVPRGEVVGPVIDAPLPYPAPSDLV